MTNRGIHPTGVELDADTAIVGLQTALPAHVTQLQVGTVTYPVADLVKLAQSFVQPWKDARAARAVIRQVMKDRKRAAAELKDFLADLKITLSVVFGKESEELRKFGFTPVGPRKQLSTEDQALALAKSQLTRELRHTMGSRQKSELQAETPSIEISPKGGMKIETSSATNPTETRPPA